MWPREFTQTVGMRLLWLVVKHFGRVVAKPLLDVKAKEGSKLGVFHVVVTILKPFSCPCYETITGGCWLLLEGPLVHKEMAEKSLLIQRWVMSLT